MSATDGRERFRSVVPRWRSLLNTPSVEIVTWPKFPDLSPITGNQFTDLIRIWRRDGSPSDAVDIMDAGIASGSRQLAVEGARKILRFSADMRPTVVETANRILFRKPSHVAASRMSSDENDEEVIRLKIAGLKRSLSDSPRNSLAHVEIARLYSRLAHYDKAEHHIRIAILISPDDRYILRSATRFLTVISKPEEALQLLWKSDATKYDPWLQSAELSAATLDGKSTKFAHKTGKRLKTFGKIGREFSELAAGWISKQYHDGTSSKPTLNLMRRMLEDPTENALAQGVWLADHMGRHFIDLFPNTQYSSDAHEAMTLTLIEKGDFLSAEAEAKSWFADQPFQARSVIQLSYLNFVHLRNYQYSAKIAEVGMVFHPKDWLLINLAIVSNCYAGNFSKADELIKRFEKWEVDPEANSFLLAAKGILAFARGNFDAAVSLYLESIKISRRHKRSDLIVNAAIYLVEMLYMHHLINTEEFASLSSEITRAISHLKLDQKASIEEIWAARKPVIESHIERQKGVPDILTCITTKMIERELLESRSL